jgi:hypothetical protein
MKTRQGFVSNSSSSSFVAALNKLNEGDLEKILAYPSSEREALECWNIRLDENRGVVIGYNFMDNGDLEEYLEENKIADVFVWGE